MDLAKKSTKLDGSVLTWRGPLGGLVRETFDSEENARARRSSLVEAWQFGGLATVCNGLVKREELP